jgi:hypothetical protein
LSTFKKKSKYPARGGRSLAFETLERRVPLDASMLRITEFLASNDEVLLDADGDSSDWLEIYNSGPDVVSLAGLHLTDDDEELDKWEFPAGTTLGPGGYLVVFASNKDAILAGGELHTNFAISADGEYLALVAADGVTVIDQYDPEPPAQVEDVSYGRAMEAIGGATTILANGAQGRAWVPTSGALDAVWRGINFDDATFPIVGPTGFGYENSPGNAVNYTAEIGTSVPSTTRSLYVRIPFTLDSLAGIDKLTLRMRYDDGFVAYINGEYVAEANAPEALQWNSIATGLHDDALSEQFIDFEASHVISKLRVGQNVLAIHALNVSGGSDMLIAPELAAQASKIIDPDQLGYFDAPTPGYGNGLNHLGFVDEPTFSVPHGYYTTAQTVSITTQLAGATILYTTNGSTPAVDATGAPINGTLYTTPLNIASSTNLRVAAFKPGYKPSNIVPQTYLFLNDVVNQSPQGQVPAGFPASGAVNGQEMNYGIDPAIVSLYGAQAVKDSLASLPAISITTDLGNLFDPSYGIYVNAGGDGRDWERPTSVELINADGTDGFATNAGLRIRGGYSRGGWNPKHAFRLYFRSEYGDGKLDYALFGDEGVDEFDVIDLRSDQNYAWATHGDTQHTMLREVFGRDLQRELGDPYTRSRYYHLYLNGQYWGVFQTQERVEEDYAAAYYGGQPEDYDILKHGLNDGIPTEINEGNDLAWRRLFDLAQALATNPQVNANNYYTMQGLNPDGTRNPALPVLLDVDNIINFALIIAYTGGYDSGISQFLGDNQANNWYGMYNRVAADQGFQFFIHDNEHSLGAAGSVHGSGGIDRTGPFNNGNQNNYNYFNPTYLHQDLLAHPEYRQRVIELATQYFLNNGPMTPAANAARMTERRNQVDGAVIAESARWGDSKVEPPRTKATWTGELNWLYTIYFPGRTNLVMNHLRNDGLFVTPPSLSPPSGTVTPGTLLTMDAAGAGTIYYTTDGMTDPRLVGGGINPSPEVKTYTAPVALNSFQVIKARTRTASGVWSALVERTYAVPQTAGDYDGNSTVDASDFLFWQRQLGVAANPVGSGADGNQSGSVDGADLAVWRDHFGEASVSVSLNRATSAGTPAMTAVVTNNQSALDAVYAAGDFASLFTETSPYRPARRLRIRV